MGNGPNLKGMRQAALLTVAAAFLLVVPAAARAATLDRPTLTVGDYWIYRTNSTVVPGLRLDGRLTSSVIDRETATVQGAPLDVFRVVLNGTGTATVHLPPSVGSGSVTGTWLLTGEDLLETTELKPVESLFGLTVTGSGFPQFTVQVQNATYFRIDDDGWTFPLSPGRSGSVVERFNSTQTVYSSFAQPITTNGTGRWTLTYSMADLTSVTTPAGTFAAYPINETWPGGALDRHFFSPDVGNDVRTESYNGTHVLLSTTQLIGFRYQAAEPPRFLGLSLTEWAAVAAVVAIATISTVLLLRRRRKGKALRGAGPPGSEP